jgi:PAS domain S-box-containing protein/putative nucleotidyltransferase with HDIG domain
MDKSLPHILIVDDDQDQLAILSDILKHKGFTPVSAQTGTAALAYSEEQDIDVALIDLRLEDMSGLEVLSSIKERFPDTECILLTGHASQASAIESINLGAYSYFQKPYDVEQLMVAIRRAAEKRTFGMALRASEASYRDLVENIQDLICTHDLKGRILSVNRAATDLVGYTAEEMIGKNLRDFLRPEDIPALKTYLADIQRDGTANGLMTVFTKNGVKRAWEYHNTLRTEGVAAPMVRGLVHDVTEQRRAEKALRDNEARYRMLAENMSDTVWLMDMNLKNFYISPSVTKLRGYTLEELNTLPLDQQMTPESLAVVMQLFMENMTPERLAQRDLPIAVTADLEFYKKDGSKFWSENTFILIRDPNGTPINILGTGRNITIRKLAEEALQNNEKRLRALIENGRDNISLLAADGTLLWESPSTNSTLGYAPNQFVGHNMFELVHPDDQGWTRDLYAQILQTPGKSRDGIFRLRHGNGTWCWIESTTTNLLNEPSVRAIVINYHDITERKQAEIERQALLEITQGMAATESLHELLELIRQSLAKVIYAENFFVVFKNKSNGLFEEVFAEDKYDPPMPPSKLEKSITSYVFRTGEPLLLTQAKFDELVAQGEVELVGTNSPSWLGAPLKTPKGTIGVMAVQNYEELDCYSQRDREFLATVSVQVSLAIERKRTEAELAASEAELRALFAAMTNVVIVYDADGRYIKIAPTNPANLYRPPDDMLGKTVHDILPKEQADYIVSKIDETLKTSQVVTCEYALQLDGKETWFSASASQLSENTVVWMAHNITERKQAEKLALQKSEHLSLLYEASQRLNRTLDLGEIYQAICDFMSFMAPNDGLCISAFDPETQLITCRAYWMENKWLDVSPFPPIPLEEEGKGTQSLVIRTGQSMLINDYQARVKTAQTSYVVNAESNEVVKEVPPEEEDITRSALIVPLKIGEMVNGVIQVMSYRLNAYTEEQLKLLEALALHIASAEQNALLYAQMQTELNERKRAEEELRDHLAELELLYQSGLAFNQLLNPKEIGQNVIDLLEQKMDWHHTIIRLYHPQTETLELLAFNQPGLKNQKERLAVEERFRTLISKSSDGISGWAIQNSQIVRMGDVSKDPRYVETYPGLNSGLYVPMKSGQRVIGVISIESEIPNAFSEAAERLVTTLANQAASALENARLFEETRQRVSELETLNRISIALRGITNKDEMLAVVLEETLNALRTSDGSINLWNREENELRQTIARGWLARLTEAPIKPGEGMFGNVFTSGETYISKEFSSDPLTLPGMRDRLPPGWGGVCVPIRSSEQAMGIFLVSAPNMREFNRNELRLLNTLAEMTGAALHRMSLHDETLRRLSHLESLRVVDRAVAGSLDKSVTLNILLDQIISQLGVDAADVLLLHLPLQTLHFTAGQGFHTSLIEKASVRVGESFAGRAVLERRTLHVKDRETARENHDFFAFWINENFADYHAVPLIAKGQVKGVIEVFRRTPFAPDPEWLNFLETLADQAAIALDNAQLFENLQGANLELTLAYDATIEGWSRAMDLRDEETEGHTLRVTEMAVSLAQAFGLTDQEILHLRRGALLHDIGKMGVPDHILLKPGKLTDEEWEIMSKHPQFAYEMLRSIAYLRPSIDIPYLHHEKWDGTGYPQGLKSDQIPLAARIFAIVDVYDALTSDRPYRKAWTKADTLQYLREQSGSHFDPQVVEKFIEVFGRTKS